MLSLKRIDTRLNRSSARPAMALPLTIIWQQGSSLPRTDDVNGKTDIPPVFLPIN